MEHQTLHLEHIEDFIYECWLTADEHGFHDVNRTFGDACTLIISEVIEAFEGYRSNGRHPGYTEVDGKPEGTLAELADIVIRVFDTAVNETGCSSKTFADVIRQKIEYNKRRPFMHNKTM